MERKLLTERLMRATEQTIQLTHEFVVDDLPYDWLYLVRPNTYEDDHRPRGDDEMFVTERVPDGQIHLAPMTAGEVIGFFWREGRVPAWINVHVARADNEHTFLFLTATGLFVTGETWLDGFGGLWPFHPQYPVVPPDWSAEDRAMRLRGGRSSAMAPPSLRDMVATRGKFRLEDNLIELWKEMVRRPPPPHGGPSATRI